jgi:hypothetical protein
MGKSQAAAGGSGDQQALVHRELRPTFDPETVQSPGFAARRYPNDAISEERAARGCPGTQRR